MFPECAANIPCINLLHKETTNKRVYNPRRDTVGDQVVVESLFSE
jgi:hypothetical protein